MNDNIRKLGYFFIVIFVVLAVYLGYLSVMVGPALSTDPHNRRLAAAEEAVVRGAIYDRNGVVLAEDRVTGGVKRRVYPCGPETAHLLGFISNQYGRTGLESAFDSYLLAMDDAGKIQAVIDRLLGRQSYGYNITLTIDSRLQGKAFNLLGGRRGAVVALDPRSGEVLAMVSSPSFDPGSLEEVVKTERSVQNGKNVESRITRYDMLKVQSEAAPLLNRAARGIYPPGSVFKIITAAAALEADPEVQNRVYDCKGSITVEGFVLKESRSHGRLDFNHALAQSCNTVFAGLGLELGEEGLKRTARSFGFALIDYDRDGRYKGDYPVVSAEIPFNPGTIPSNQMGGPEVASTAIGQGRTLVSPFQMALITAGIANGGVVMKPAVLASVTTGRGSLRKKMSPEIFYRATSPEAAGRVAAAMEDAVKQGTGYNAFIPGIRVAGKTGSAQNPGGQAHAWFVGFAPAEDPRIALAVVVENAGAGSNVAAPVAREVIKEYLRSGTGN
jgi:peptidoglycan glycosyltransferase